MRPILKGRGIARVLGGTLVVGGLLMTAAGVANAKVTASPPGPADLIVTDYANYPTVVPPDGCEDGAEFLTGATYTVNGVAYSTLRENDSAGPGQLEPGDVIVMHWNGYFGGSPCESAIGVSLTVKSSTSPDFDATKDQALLLDFAYCGPDEGAIACADTQPPYTLSLTMPDYAEGTLQDQAHPACDYQVDAVIGGPLMIVGPNGSFYGASLRGGGPDMILSANNGGPDACAIVTKTAEVAEGSDATLPPADTDYLICLTPSGEGAGPIEGGEVGCPENAIAVVVKKGETKGVVIEPGTTYDVTEILGDGVHEVGAFEAVDGANLINLTNIYDCADREDSPQQAELAQTLPYRVVIDLDCTTVDTTVPTTVTTIATTTTASTTTQETTTTIATTTSGATTTAATTTTGATTTISRGGPPPEETVEGETVNRDVIVDETLPVTGNSAWPAARIGILMVLSGAAALALSKRRRAEA